MASTLGVEDVRIDVDDVPAVDGLTLATTGARALVLGAPRALFEAACGLRTVVRGSLTILGTDAIGAVRDRIVAGAPLDPPLPPTWTPLEYAAWSARLAGHGKAEAAAAAKEAVSRLELRDLGRAQHARLTAHARRASVVAAALATAAKAIVLEDPIGGLPEETARAWSQMLVAALSDRSWIVFAPRVPLTSPLAAAAEEAIVVSGSRVDAQGPPASLAFAERRFSLRAHGPVEVLTARLAGRGVEARSDGARLVVDLRDAMTTAELLRICVETAVTVVELYPIARALA